MISELAMLQMPDIPIEQLQFIRELVKTVFTSLAVMVVGFPLARAIGRRLERRPEAPAVPTDLTSRLERIEQAVDAMAIEVERISEGQRFVTRMLTERASAAGHVPGGS